MPDAVPLKEEPPRAGIGRFLRRVVGLAGLGIVIAGSLVWLTVRDRFFPISVAFYMLPLGVLAGLAWFAVLVLPGGRARSVSFVLAVGISAIWGSRGWSFHEPKPSEKPIRIAFWNVARGVMGWSGVIEQVREFDADLIGMVETDKLKHPKETWRTAFPDRDVAVLEGGLTLIVRGRVEGTRQVPLRSGCFATAVDVEIDGQPLRAVLVDIYSSPVFSRQVPLTRLAAELPEDDRPTLVMGDFNTPADSVWFGPLRERFTHAFEAAGSGYAATWPLPFPVLTLDQIWGDSRCRFDECHNLWTARSDHRPVRCILRVEMKSQGE